MTWSIYRLDEEKAVIEAIEFETLDAARGQFERLCAEANETCTRCGWEHVAYELREVGAVKYLSYFSLHRPVRREDPA